MFYTLITLQNPMSITYNRDVVAPSAVRIVCLLV